MIQIHEQDIFECADLLQLFFQHLVVKQLADLETDLCKLVGIKRRNTGLGGAIGLACQTCFFIGIL